MEILDRNKRGEGFVQKAERAKKEQEEQKKLKESSPPVIDIQSESNDTQSISNKE